MQKKISLRLLPHEASDDNFIKKFIAKTCGKKFNDITGFTVLKKSIDARGKIVYLHLTVLAFINEPFLQRNFKDFNFKDVAASQKKVVIIGAGPAGLFAALQLIELGIKPVILERGKDVRDRRRDLAQLNRNGILNPESNYCFGEGGAGTYSDGKLYTRSSKRGNIDRILNLFYYFGAEENILYEAHPHIGTNKLPQIITAMRAKILACGGEIHFNTKVIDFIVYKDHIKEAVSANGYPIHADAFILATGHSARDIFELLYNKNIAITAKPFALGVRIEHPQEMINTLQYKSNETIADKGFDVVLPPAAYSLVEQVDGRGVFSFCMCPGGIIAPAATEQDGLVVNGWSPSKRNNPYANSGIVVQLEKEEVINYFLKSKDKKHSIDSPLLMMHFQKEIEQKAYEAGGGNFVAPAQRMIDFTENKFSSTLPQCSYLPGITSAEIKNILPDFINERLKKALKLFGRKLRIQHNSYLTNEAVLVATESRTSSPVRIPRHEELLSHPQIQNFFPCGEGAGYAGGIVSAAMDGERVARQLAIMLDK